MSRRAVVALLLTLTTIAGLGTACSRGAPAVNPSLTRTQVQDRLVALLGETVGFLPAEVSLASTTPENGTLGPGTVVPCVDDNTITDPPVNLELSYWVTGFASDRGSALLQSLGDSFTRRGYDTKPDGAQTVRGYTPDGYALVAQLNSRGGLSLTGSTPCFPVANRATTTPEPTVIPHP